MKHSFQPVDNELIKTSLLQNDQKIYMEVMEQPIAFIRPVEKQGPSFDPMDRMAEDLENIQSFITYFRQNPRDTDYFPKHYPRILAIRKVLELQLDLLENEPYGYAIGRINMLKNQVEKIFSLLEGIAGAVESQDQKELKKFIKACEKELSLFDNALTP